ncbi:MAG: hypothetical protein JRF48_06045 [Deltaproteobacteria bacterium]|nr:hypothetical protein [Deltaproteobacteria bacterium]
MIEQLDPDELCAPLLLDFFLHAPQQLGGEFFTGPSLKRDRYRVHALAEMNRA